MRRRDEHLHPKSEDADKIEGTATEVPAAAAQATSVEIAERQAIVARVTGIGAHPLLIERDTLTRRFKVSEDQTCHQTCSAETTHVVSRQFEFGVETGE